MTVHRRARSVRPFATTPGLRPLPELLDEMDEYVAVLTGNAPSPVDDGMATLQVIADSYFARACEIEGRIHRAERNGDVERGSDLYKFRTGELQSYLALFKSATKLGSRLLSYAQEERA